MAWAAEVLEAVQMGRQMALERPGIRVPDAEDPERLVRMASVAMLDLPKPLQTLLSALRELKLDLARDAIRTRANMESRIRAFCESRVAFICNAIDSASEGIRRCNEDVWATVLEADPQFSNEVHKLLSGTAELPPSEWRQALIEACRGFQKSLASHDLGERPAVRDAPRPVYASVDLAVGAVKSSQDMRQRLIDLATGPLASLFEPSADRASPRAPMDLVVPGTSSACTAQAKAERAEAAHKLLQGQKLLRRLQRNIAMARASRDVLYEDVIANLIWALKQCKDPPESHVISLEDQSTDMKTADAKLQKEIAFVLQTLTVDRSSLDMVLRSIKAVATSCDVLAARESATAWNIQMLQWASRLQESMGLYTDALRSEPVAT